MNDELIAGIDPTNLSGVVECAEPQNKLKKVPEREDSSQGEPRTLASSIHVAPQLGNILQLVEYSSYPLMNDAVGPEELTGLGCYHLHRFQCLGELVDLEEALKYFTRAVALTPYGHPNLPLRLTYLGSSHGTRSECLGELRDLEKAIEHISLALALTPEDHPDKSYRLTTLGGTYYTRFQRLGGLEDLEKAIEHLSRALKLTPDGHPDLSRRLVYIGSAYGARSRRLGELNDLEKSIECHSRALALTFDDHLGMSHRLADLGASYLDLFQRLGDLEDLEKSIKNLSRALVLTPDGHPDMPGRLADIGTSYSNRFHHMGQLQDLEKSIEFHSRAVVLTPVGHPDTAHRLTDLGSSYGTRSRRLGNLEDIEKAIECLSRALVLTCDGHPDMSRRVADLGASYLDRFQRLREPDDLEKAIEHSSRALALTFSGHPDMSGRHTGLGISFFSRFHHLGDLEDLEKSIKHHSRALALTPDDHPDMSRRLADLGASYLDRFQRLGELNDIEVSIEHFSGALASTPDRHPAISSRLTSLGASYLDRFRHLGELQGLDKSIEYQSRALASTPSDHPDMSHQLANLGVSYFNRFQYMRQLQDLEKSIEYHSRALSLIPDDHPEIARRLTDLGSSYGTRSEFMGDFKDLEKAIEHFSRALVLTPDGHPDMPIQLTSLGVSYFNRFRHLREPDDLEGSIECHSRALSSTPDGHPTLSRQHCNLALSYFSQFLRTGDLSDSQKSSNAFRNASQLMTGAPRERFQCALQWVHYASQHSSLDCIEAYQTAIDLLPQFIWLGATTTQRYRDLPMTENLAVNAANAAICSSNFVLALEWLEHARCVVWSQSLMLRSPLDQLHSSHPDLASRLQTVAYQLDRASSRATAVGPSTSDSYVPEHIDRNRRRWARDYQNLLAEARQLPGFEDFLQPIKAKDLMRAARNGPVVVINGHKDRCDVLFILPWQEYISHLHLPNFTNDKAKQVWSQMEASLGHRGQKEREYRRPFKPDDMGCTEQVLKTLWSDIVEPVLDFLGYMNNHSTDKLPHITWCPTGALSFLPLHAAGDYSQPKSRVFNYAISSYTPTLAALLASNPTSLGRDDRVLAVGQAGTPGHTRLPGTVEELACLKAQATTKAVLDAMEGCHWVHLACHAHQSIADPTKSGFFLHDGTLDIASINQRSFTNKGLAFLSACQTATGDKVLPDEVIHLASGMLTAGYLSVIAAMWSIHDDDAPFVADQVYAQLLRDGKLGNGEAGTALQNAVASLREKVGEKEFGRWVPYIHIGS